MLKVTMTLYIFISTLQGSVQQLYAVQCSATVPEGNTANAQCVDIPPDCNQPDTVSLQEAIDAITEVEVTPVSLLYTSTATLVLFDMYVHR